MQTSLTDARLERFCSGNSFDRTLADSEHFRCVASLGSIVPGWVLVVPKEPRLNLARLTASERVDFGRFAAQVATKIQKSFGEIVLFEHGANAVGSSTGCGVDQAHLHVVPVGRARFSECVTASGRSFEVGAFSWPFELATGAEEYLWHSDMLTSAITLVDEPQRQFYRRLVARAVCKPEEWDYRLHPALENIAKTQAVVL